MTIDFSKLEEARFPQFKGGEKETALRFYDDGLNRIMLGRLEPGASIGMHKHEANSEILYILHGCGKVLCDGGEEPITAGECHYCPKGHAHSLINDGDADLAFFAVVPAQ